MNVLFWTSSFPSYSETFIRNQVINLIDHNINVLIYTNNKDSSQSSSLDNLESYGLLERVTSKNELYHTNKVIRVLIAFKILLGSLFTKNFKFYLKSLNSKRYGNAAKSLKHFYFISYLLKNKIDVIHAHYGPNGNDAAVYKEIGLPVKLICTFHGYDIRLGDKKPKIFYNILFKYADKIISISDYNYNKLIGFGLAKNKLVSINNGVRLGDDDARVERDNDVIKILSVGRLVEDKAIDLALKALHKLHKDYPQIQWQYDIIGDGELENALKELTEEFKLTSKVKFHLYQDSNYVKSMMNTSDFLLLTSVNEALPTVILEAQALKLPVIATNVGSVSNLVIDNHTGFLVEPNVDSIYEGLVKLIENKEKWEDYGINGHRIVEENYDEEKEIIKLIDLYKTWYNG